MATISRLSVNLTANTKRFRRGMLSAKKSLGGFVSSVFSAKTAIVGLVGAAGIGLMTKNLIDTNARIQTLKASLKTMTGGVKEAAKAFTQIEEFAETTPFDLEQVVSAFIKLKALGLDPSQKAMRAYGNVASALGKDMNQMVEAVADAATGEFERLKEFGIKASKQGDEVTFTFQGISKTVKNTAKDISGFLQGIGENQFGSAMSDQMGNLTPAFSNLGAAFDMLKVKVGESGLNDLISSIVNSITAFINGLSTEKIQAFTKSVVLMGFSMARSFVGMIGWLGKFSTGMGSLDSIWLAAKLGAVEFAIGTLNAFLMVTRGFAKMVTSLQGASAHLPDFLGGQQIFAGLTAVSDGALNLQLLIRQLQREQLAPMAGGLRSDLSAQNRIDSGSDSFAAGVEKFTEGADKWLDNQQDLFEGKDTPNQLPLGRDPRLDELNGINNGIQELINIQRPYSFSNSGAIAG